MKKILFLSALIFAVAYMSCSVPKEKVLDLAYKKIGRLENMYVTPQEGDTVTTFTFFVTYVSPLNTPPLPGIENRFIKIEPDVPKAQLVEQDSNDTNYRDGKVYTYTTQLPSGDYTYKFGFRTRFGRYIESESLEGPIVNPSIAKLSITNLTVIPRNPKEDDNVSISVEVWNRGDVSSPPCIVRIYVGGKQIGSDREILGIAPKSVKVVQQSWTAQKGEFWQITATLDRAPRVSVDDVDIERGDISTTIGKVMSLPCLKISSFIVIVEDKTYKEDDEITVKKGDKVRFVFTILNTGEQDVFSGDYELKSFGDIFSIPKPNIKALSYSDPIEVLWTAAIEENRELGFLLSDKSGIPEIKILEGRKSVMVRVATEADIEVSRVDIISPAYPSGGEQVKIAVYVDNDGGLPAKAKDYYLWVGIDGDQLGIYEGPDIPPYSSNKIVTIDDPWVAIKGEHTISADLYYKQKFVNSKAKKIDVKPYPNLELEVSEIEFSPTRPYEGESVTVSARIHDKRFLDIEYGGRSPNSFYVNFSIDNQHHPFTVTPVTIDDVPSSTEFIIESNWRAIHGHHDFMIVVTYPYFTPKVAGGVSSAPYERKLAGVDKSSKLTVGYAPANLEFLTISMPSQLISGNDLSFEIGLKNSGSGGIRGGKLQIVDSGSGDIVHEDSFGPTGAGQVKKVQGVISGEELVERNYSWKILITQVVPLRDDCWQKLSIPPPEIKNFQVIARKPIDDLTGTQEYCVLTETASRRKTAFEELGSALSQLSSYETFYQSIVDTLKDVMEVAQKALDELLSVDALLETALKGELDDEKLIEAGLEAYLGLPKMKWERLWGDIRTGLSKISSDLGDIDKAFKAYEIAKEFDQVMGQSAINKYVHMVLNSTDFADFSYNDFRELGYEEVPYGSPTFSLKTICNTVMPSLFQKEEQILKDYQQMQSMKQRSKLITIFEKESKVAEVALYYIDECYINQITKKHLEEMLKKHKPYAREKDIKEIVNASKLREQAKNTLNAVKGELKRAKDRAGVLSWLIE